MARAEQDDEGSGGPASFTADELERGAERLARLVLRAQALAERKRASGISDEPGSGAQQRLRRLETGVELVRGALGLMLRQALRAPDGDRRARPGRVPHQRRADER